MSHPDVHIADKKFELRALQRKELELLSSLEAINESFAELSIPITTNNPNTGYTHPTDLQSVISNPAIAGSSYVSSSTKKRRQWQPSPEVKFDLVKYKSYGIRMGNKLSFRGEDKAREYFDMIDDDHDGFIDFEESKAVHAFRHPFGMITNASHQSREAWRTYMKNEGYSLVSNNNKLSKQDYVKYRVVTDAKQPLLYELSILGLGFIPSYLTRWQFINTIISEVEKYREYCKSLNASDVKKLEGILTMEEIMFIVNNSDINLTKPEIFLMMLWRKQKANMLMNLTRVYAKRNLSQKEYNFEVEKNRKMKPFHVTNTASSLPLGEGIITEVDSNTSRPVTTDSTKVDSSNRNLKKKNMLETEVIPGSNNDFKLIIGSRSETNTVTPHDVDHVPVSQFKAWLLAVPNFMNFEMFYRRILRFKYSFYRWSRMVTDKCRFLFHFAGHLNDRLVFREFLPIGKMSRYYQEVSTLKLSLQVGGLSSSAQMKKGYAHQTSGNGKATIAREEVKNIDGAEDDLEGDGNVGGDEDVHNNGLSLTWKLMKVENPEAIMTKLNIPTSCGSILFIDLLYKDKVSLSKQQETCESLKKFILQQIERELKQNISFTLMNCIAMKNEYDDSPIIRIVIAYKKLVSIDKFLEHQLLPYRFSDLVTMFVGDLKSNIDFHEYFHNKVNTLDEMFHMTLTCTIGYRKNLLMAIIERAMLAMNSGMTEAQADFLNQRNQQRNSSSDDNSQSGSTVPTRTNVSTLNLANVQKKGTSAETFSVDGMDDDTSAMRQYRWMLVYPHYPAIAETLKKIFDVAYSWRNSAVRWQFRSLSDFMMRLPFLFGIERFRSVFTVEQKTMLFKPGYVRELYLDFVKCFKEEFGSLFDELKEFLERRKKEEDHRRFLELISFEKKKEQEESFKAMESKKNSTLERMKRIGLEGEELDAMLTNEEYDKNPLLYINSQETDNRLGDITTFRLMELITENLVGLHSVELLSGKNKLTAQIHGMDVIHLIPKMASMNEVFHKTSFSKKGSQK